MKYLITVMFILLVLLVASLWTGHGSYPAKWQLEKEIAELDKQNEHQEELNRQIRAELEDAQSGSDAVEERARSELGMIRNQETFFEVILEPNQTLQIPESSVNQDATTSQIK